MIPYLLIIFVAFLFSIVAVERRKKGTELLTIGNSEYIRNNNIGIYAFFLALFIVLSLRGLSIGNDTRNYEYFFLKYASLDLISVFKVESDKLYVLLNWFIGKFTTNYQIFLTIIAGLTIIPIAILYSKDRRYSFLTVILFMNMSVFVMMFSGFRQSLAVSVGIIAYKFVKQRKPKHFVLIALIALGLHHTAFMVLFMYPLYHLKINKRNLFTIIPVIAAVFIFNKQIFAVLVDILSNIFGEKYDVEVTVTNAYTFIILFVLFAVFSYVIPDEEKMDAEALGLRNYLLFAVLLQCFAPIHSLSMRLNYYYIIFIPFAMPKFISYAKDKNKSIAQASEYVLIAFFLAYYLYTTYISCKTGNSALNIYPYVPFWGN